jgi:hypothetical protein
VIGQIQEIITSEEEVEILNQIGQVKTLIDRDHVLLDIMCLVPMNGEDYSKPGIM